ncbi:MAG: DUF3137 domain-containing protein [Candidatus Omnitrophica bacterium]|nr:DUF3137 domain-containing protein [Candidatus Omnitrophota bacterium]MBU1995715.1 DUF3137 domain-containing protein [Candidatus Omnitrophota bacterium]MBU4333700.1 DUF3137 domain-containing protein [Candidatus Omnitrophota bacterium]
MEINPIFPTLLPFVVFAAIPVVIVSLIKLGSQGMKKNFQRQAEKRGGYVEEKFYHFSPRLVIPYIDQKIIVYSTPGSRNSPPYTHLKYKFSSSRNINLTVYKEGLFSKLGKTLGMQDLIVDDPVFDETFIIKGKDEILVRQLLSLNVKEKLLTLVSLNVRLRINGGSVYLSVPSKLTIDTDLGLFIEAGLAVVQKVTQLG